MSGGILKQAYHATVLGRNTISREDSPDTAAVYALDEVLGQKRGEVALDTAPVRPPDVALSIAQVAWHGEHPPKASDLWDQSSRDRWSRWDEQDTGAVHRTGWVYRYSLRSNRWRVGFRSL